MSASDWTKLKKKLGAHIWDCVTFAPELGVI